MDQGQQMIETLVSQVKDLLNSRNVTGEPVTVGDVTIVPVTGYGFGFGGGAGAGTQPNSTEQGVGSGAAGGGGIKPVALVVIDKEGARVELVRGGRGAGFVESVGKVVEQIIEKQKEGDSKKSERSESE